MKVTSRSRRTRRDPVLSKLTPHDRFEVERFQRWLREPTAENYAKLYPEHAARP